MLGLSSKYLNTKEVPIYRDFYKGGEYLIQCVENTHLNVDLARGYIRLTLPPIPHEGCKIALSLKYVEDCTNVLYVAAGTGDVFECVDGDTHPEVDFIPTGSLTVFHSKKTSTGYKWVLYSCEPHACLNKKPSVTDGQLLEMWNWYERNKHHFN